MLLISKLAWPSIDIGSIEVLLDLGLLLLRIDLKIVYMGIAHLVISPKHRCDLCFWVSLEVWTLLHFSHTITKLSIIVEHLLTDLLYHVLSSLVISLCQHLRSLINSGFEGALFHLCLKSLLFESIQLLLLNLFLHIQSLLNLDLIQLLVLDHPLRLLVNLGTECDILILELLIQRLRIQLEILNLSLLTHSKSLIEIPS